MQIPPILPANAPPAAASGQAPEARPRDPVDRSGGTSLEQAARVLTREQREPVDPASLARFSYQAADNFELEESYRLPDGRLVLSFSSFDTDRDPASSPGGYTVAFDAAGKELWRYQPPAGHNLEMHLFRSDGRTVVLSHGTGAWDGSKVCALDAAGQELWRYESPGRTQIDSMQADPAGNLYLKQGDLVVSLHPDGRERWKRKLRIHSDEFFHLTTPDHSQVFAGENFSNNFGHDQFNLVSPDGRVRDLKLPDIGSFPLSTPERVFYAGERGEARGIDLTSFKGWEVETGSSSLKTPFAGPDGRVYFAGRHDDALYAFTPEGTKLWERKVQDRRADGDEDPFKPDRDGCLYYAHEDGESIAQIRPDGTTGKKLAVPGGFESFLPGGDRYLYTVDRDATVRRIDPSDGTFFTLRLKLPENIRWELGGVEPGGVVWLQDRLGGVFWCLPVRPEDQAAQDLEEARRAPESSGSPGIREEADWVVVGSVRVRKRAG